MTTTQAEGMTVEERAAELIRLVNDDRSSLPSQVISQALREAERRGWERCREAAAELASGTEAFAAIRSLTFSEEQKLDEA